MVVECKEERFESGAESQDQVKLTLTARREPWEDRGAPLRTKWGGHRG